MHATMLLLHTTILVFSMLALDDHALNASKLHPADLVVEKLPSPIQVRNTIEFLQLLNHLLFYTNLIFGHY